MAPVGHEPHTSTRLPSDRQPPRRSRAALCCLPYGARAPVGRSLCLLAQGPRPTGDLCARGRRFEPVPNGPGQLAVAFVHAPRAAPPTAPTRPANWPPPSPTARSPARLPPPCLPFPFPLSPSHSLPSPPHPTLARASDGPSPTHAHRPRPGHHRACKRSGVRKSFRGRPTLAGRPRASHAAHVTRPTGDRSSSPGGDARAPEEWTTGRARTPISTRQLAWTHGGGDPREPVVAGPPASPRKVSGPPPRARRCRTR